MAHHIAEWLGIPTGIVIAAMMTLRKQGMALRARRQQARTAKQQQARTAKQQQAGTANQQQARTVNPAAGGPRPGGLLASLSTSQPASYRAASHRATPSILASVFPEGERARAIGIRATFSGPRHD
jgi:hypothetical protein